MRLKNKQMKKQPEFILQRQICAYLRVAYPDVLFMSDTIASVKLSEAQASRNKSIQKSGFKTPDLIIFAPRGIYHGLFIELKKESPYKLNGDLKTNFHLQGQEETMLKLRSLGYFACFKWILEDAKEIIDWYLNLIDNES